MNDDHDLFGKRPKPPKPPVTPEDSDAGRRLRSRRRDALAAGHARAKIAGDNAERVNEGWMASAIELTLQFARVQPGGFLIEDARGFAEKHGLPDPPTKRAWGALTQRLKRGEPGRRIVNTGQSHTDSYGSLKAVWVAA